MGKFICEIFSWPLLKIYELTGNYGFAIIFFALLVNLIMLPFMAKSKKGMMRTTRIQPKIQELQRRHEGNPQKLNQEMQKLYREEGVNPMGGCIWSLIPFPILIALYSVIRQQLTRIYGVSFPKKSMLDEYLQMLEEAKKRDHRKLGKEMELFTFSSRVGLGLPLWLPRGAQMRYTLEQFLRRKQAELGYLQVVTPHIGAKDLYVTSGHYAKYGKDSFQPIHTPQEGEEYMLKPMNCPHHCEIFRSSPRSYRDLPLRFAEFGTVYRYEQSGELHGLTRVRGFTQDDAHLFCRPDQLQEEFEKVIDLILYVFKTLNMTEYMAQISLRDPENKNKYIGSDENWDKAEKAIIEAADKKGLKTVVELGEAAFYGPKLDFMVKDAIGRRWQLGTIQVDYNLPERFGLEYTDADGSKQRPVMIHRAPFGSIERFTAVVLEHTAGHLPLWLAPDQVKILPISEKYADYAKKVCDLLKNSEIRASIDSRNETLGKRIRDISLLRVPVLVIVGEKEAAEGTVSVRREGADKGSMSVEDFVKYINTAIAEELS